MTVSVTATVTDQNFYPNLLTIATPEKILVIFTSPWVNGIATLNLKTVKVSLSLKYVLFKFSDSSSFSTDDTGIYQCHMTANNNIISTNERVVNGPIYEWCTNCWSLEQ